MAYANLTAPFNGGNPAINDLEVDICTEEDVNLDLTINTQALIPEGDEYNTEM